MVLPLVRGGLTTSELISYLKSSLCENEVNAPVHQFVVLHHSCCVGVIAAELNCRKSWQSHLSVYSHQAQVGSFLPEIHYFLLGLPGVEGELSGGAPLPVHSHCWLLLLFYDGFNCLDSLSTHRRGDFFPNLHERVFIFPALWCPLSLLDSGRALCVSHRWKQ